MEKTFIYTISDGITIRYIGKSNNIQQRLKGHLNDTYNPHKTNWLKSIIKKGKYPKIEILEEVSVSEWQYWEQYWISQFKQWGYNLLNLTEGGDGGNGFKHTDESKKKMRASKIGGKLSKEHKKKISKSVKNKAKENPMYNRGKGNSMTYLDKKLLYDKYIVEDMSMPQLSKFIGVSETKIFRELKRYGIKKEKGWWLDKISKQYKKPVLQYNLDGELIKEWDGIVDIYNELGYNKTNLASCCRNTIKTSRNFIWRYKDEWIELPNLQKSISENIKRPIQQLNLDNSLVKEYDTISEAAKEKIFRSDKIRQCCEGKVKTHKGFIWRFI